MAMANNVKYLSWPFSLAAIIELNRQILNSPSLTTLAWSFRFSPSKLKSLADLNTWPYLYHTSSKIRISPCKQRGFLPILEIKALTRASPTMEPKGQLDVRWRWGQGPGVGGSLDQPITANPCNKVPSEPRYINNQ